MGKIYPDLVGAFTNAVGGTVYYVRCGQNVARRKGVRRKNRTFLQEQQQECFGALARLGALLKEVISMGFVQRKQGVFDTNVFIQRNKDICRVGEEGRIAVNYEKLVCSEGDLREPEVTVMQGEGEHDLTFICEEMEVDKDALPDDRIMGVMFDTVNGFCRCVELCERREGGATNVTLEEEWNLEALAVYAFAVSKGGRRVSGSVYLPLV